MTLSRLGDYLDHIRQAASDAISFVVGLNKDEFWKTVALDKRL